MGSCPVCGVENPDGARFCISCGSSLVPACPVCGAERPEGARYCPSCGARLVEDQPAPAGRERRLVTILFADVTGSTGLGERLDPERLQDVLATYFAAMREEIEAEGGTVEKFIGDAVMAAFGVPTAHEDDPVRALRAALRMRARLDEVNDELRRRFGVELRIRTGVNTGEVLAATAPAPGEPMATGDAVNVAARLEQLADPGQIVVAERTARAARGFRFRELGPQAVRGKAEHVPAVILEGEAPEAVERGVPGLRAPMVGRDEELALLRAVYRRSAAERRPNLVTIYGEPGVGKSRLVREFLGWAETQDPTPYVGFGRCLPYGEGITYWPFAEILKQHAGVLDTDPTDVVLGKIETSCDAVCEIDPSIDVAATCRAVAYTAGLEFPQSPMHDRDPRRIRAEMHAAWRSFFSALATSAPVIAVIEDIHWADEALLDLLRDLADRVIGPVLFVCPARPELLDKDPGWGGGGRNLSSIALDPLSRDDADRLVAFLLDVDDLPPSVRARILERAEGNPFFLEEIVRQLIDEGRIVRDGDRWRASGDVTAVQIPDTVQGVLAARIDLLDPTDKRALQRAAVVGRVFWPGPVGRLLNGDRDRLRDALDRLEQLELVRSQLTSSIAGEPEFIFKHILTRDVAYESLPRRERGRAHASVAEWIEATTGDRRAEFAELLAHHHDQAYRGALEDEGDPESAEALRVRAFEAVLAAGEATRRRFAVEGAFRLAERAIELAAKPLERAQGLELRGLIARNDYRGDLSWTSFKDAVDIRLRDVPNDPRAIASACAQAVENPMRWPGSMSQMPDEDEVRRYIDIGLEHAPPGSTEWIGIETAVAFTPFAFSQRRPTSSEEVEASRRAGLDAADAALAIDRPDLASAALDGAGSALVTIGDYGSLVRINARRLELAEGFDDPWERGDVYDMVTWDWVMVGDYEEARRYGDRALDSLQVGVEGLAIHGLSWLAVAELQLGNWRRVVEEIGPTVERLLGPRIEHPPYFTQNLIGSLAVIGEARADPGAERYVRLLHEMLEGRKDELGNGGITSWLAWWMVISGRAHGAQVHLDAAERVPFRGHLPLVRQVQAEQLAETGRWDEVPAFVREARSYSTWAGLRALPVHVDRLEGRAALAAGDHARAAELLHRATAGFAALSARWEHARTDAFLAEALVEMGRGDDARERLTRATDVLAAVGATRDLERWGELSERLR